MKTTLASSHPTSGSSSLPQLMRQYPLFSFFFMAYAFSWIISIPYLLSQWGVIPGDYTIMYMLKQWAGPALAAIIMINLMEGNAGLQGLRRSIRQWRAGWQWYLFTMLGIPMMILIGIIIQPGLLANFQGLPSAFLVSYLINFVAVFFGVGLPEEIGWRGFALPRMQPRFGPLRATLLLGTLWAFWHLLYFLTPSHGGGPGSSLAAFLINFSIFFLMVVAITIIFTWVFNHTRGSVFIASLAHTSIDTPQLVWAPLFLAVGQINTSAGETSLNLALLITFGILALLIVILTRGQLGYRPNQEQPLRPVEIGS